MSHTYTRTSALLEEFSSCFNDADILYLHKIYASARENYKGGVNGHTLYEKSSVIRADAGKEQTFYVEEVDDTFQPLCETIKSGDIFITLGAGNNWTLGVKLFKYFSSKNEGKHG